MPEPEFSTRITVGDIATSIALAGTGSFVHIIARNQDDDDGAWVQLSDRPKSISRGMGALIAPGIAITMRRGKLNYLCAINARPGSRLSLEIGVTD
jgi:hypothetical protein